jgi:segregation and condensation protein B
MNEEQLFQNLRIAEALLFTAQDTMTENDFKSYFEKGTDISLVLEHLQQHYASRGVNLVQRGNGWGFRTSPDLAEKLEVRKVEVRPMSRVTVETLAIIAYHQPVTRAEIEQIRGVSIGKNVFEFLIGENLIKPGKRREVPGRPLTWITTQHFLDTFGLESLKQLPNLQELKDTGLLSMQPPQLANVDQPSLPLALDDQESSDEDMGTTDFNDDDFAMADEDDTTPHSGEAA